MSTVRDLSGNSPLDGTSGFKDSPGSKKDRLWRSYPVTASDSVNLPNGTCEALCVTTAGTYKVTYENGQNDDPYLAAGIWHPMRVKRVWSTGSASTSGIKAGY